MKARTFPRRLLAGVALGAVVGLSTVLAVTAPAGTAPAEKAATAAKVAEPGARTSAPAAPVAAPAPRAANPHGNITLDCRLCHVEQGAGSSDPIRTFDHTTTGFALDGLHAQVACNDCHRQPRFSHVGTQCADCHLDTHKGRLGPDCAQCHSPAGWVDRPQTRRDHDRTRLPLVGAHATVDCDACHVGAVRGEYVGTPFACDACHHDRYAATASPNHAQAGFGTDCEQCHGVFAASWGSGDFVHSSRFPLTGGHATIECRACHTNGFQDASTDCYACHQADFDATVNPPHAATGMGTACAICHSTVAWRPTQYDHASTGFPLTGGHGGVDCAACHQSGYVGTPTDCYACHRPDFEGATDPNHVAGAYPTDCTMCHVATRWDDTSFDHARTAFPLTGAHVAQACAACHSTGYSNTPTDCYACHQTDYTGTTNPNHVTSGIATTCVTCHSTTAWSPATFNHNQTAFPLTGAHTSQSCLACHATGYSNTPTDCYACHRADYDGTSNPNHAAASFPTTCVTCHSTTAWEPSSWDHETLFPIESGNHRNLDCAQCHVNTSNYAAFECILCHEHNQQDMADEHRDRNDYQWVSTACYTCHPRGR